MKQNTIKIEMPGRFSNFMSVDLTIEALQKAGVKFKINKRASLCIQKTRLWDLCNDNAVEPIVDQKLGSLPWKKA